MTANPREKQSSRIPELDGVRAFCVMAVVIGHSATAGHFPFLSSDVSHCLNYFGSMGVQVFFGISGFIITRLLLREKAQTGHVSLSAFYVRRFFRIVPAFYAFLLVVAVLMSTGVIIGAWPPYFCALFFVSNYHYFPNALGNAFTGHTWSLSVEEQYYVILPFLLWVVLRGKRQPMVIALVALYFFTMYSDRMTFLHLSPEMEALTPFKYIIAGVLLALAWEKSQFLFRNVSIIVPVFVLLFLMGRAVYGGWNPQFFTKVIRLSEAPGIVYLLGWVVLNPDRCGFLRLGIVQWVGRASYSIYLWQQIFTGKDFRYGPVKLATLPWALFGILACAAASYSFIEKPSIRLAHRLSQRMSPPPIAKKKLREPVLV